MDRSPHSNFFIVRRSRRKGEIRKAGKEPKKEK
jgi:hypothetical protein